MLEILFGLFLIFWGSRFFKFTFGFLVWVVSTGILFLLCYNLCLGEAMTKGKTGEIIGVACACAVIGLVFAYCGGVFADKFFFQIVGALAVGTLVMFLLATVPIAKWLRWLLIVLGLALGCYVSNKS